MLCCGQFKIGFDEMLSRTLWLAMWNHDTFGHNDFLGEVMLPLDTYQDSGFSWDDPSPYWYPLRERVSVPPLHVTTPSSPHCFVFVFQFLWEGVGNLAQVTNYFQEIAPIHSCNQVLRYYF